MAGSTVATGVVMLTPKFDNLTGTITKDLNSAFSDSSKIGKQAGKSIGDGLTSGIDNASSVSKTILNGLGDAAKTVGKTVAVGIAGIAASTAAITKLALDQYANYEQQVGGVKKLYGNAGMAVEEYAQSVGKSVDEIQDSYNALEKAQNTVLENAKNAYKTSGMSANAYMEQATSFSAALINSLGGDTQKAAEQTEVAMKLMSDNINTFGTNAEDVYHALQGAAKQNYTMLDNLKLGYGGTKAEMQRLIEDANEYAESIGQAGDLTIDSFSDIITALELIQEKQGIAGTTAKEAATTIEGAIGSAKAAWENFLTGLGDEDADLSQLTENLLASVGAVAKNVAPRVAQIGKGIIQAIPSALSGLANTLAPVLEEALVAAWNVAAGALNGIGLPIPQIDTSAFASAADAVKSFVDEYKQLATAGASVAGSLVVGSAVFEGYKAGKKTIEGLSKTFGTLKTKAGDVKAAFQLAGDGIKAITSNAGSIGSQLAGVFGNVGKGIGNYFSEPVEAILYPFQQLGGKIAPLLTPLGDTIGGAIQSAGWVAQTYAQAAVEDISGKFSSLGTKITTWLQPLTTQISTALTPLKTALSGIMSGFTQTFGALGMVVSPVMIAVVAIAALAAGFAYMYTTSEQFRTAVQGIIAQMQTALQPALVALQPIIEQIKTAITDFATFLTTTLLPTLGNISLIVLQVAADLLPIVSAAITSIIAVIQAGATFINTVVQAIMTVIQDIINVGLAVINGDWSAVWTGIQQLASDVWSGIESVIQGAIDLVGSVINAGLALVQSVWAAAWTAVGNLVTNAWDLVTSTVDDSAGQVLDIVSGIPSGIEGFFSDAGSLLVDAGKAIINGLLDGLKSAIDAVYDFVGGIASTIASLKGPLSYDRVLLTPAGEAIINGLQTGLENNIGDVYSFVGGIAGGIQDAFAAETAAQALTMRAQAYVETRAQKYASVTVDDEAADISAQNGAAMVSLNRNIKNLTEALNDNRFGSTVNGVYYQEGTEIDTAVKAMTRGLRTAARMA